MFHKKSESNTYGVIGLGRFGRALATELAMGRVRLRHWGERNIDLDLLLYEDVVLDTPRLRLPHPDMQNRDFVLLPLAEIAPELKHPTLQKTIWELKEDLMNR